MKDRMIGEILVEDGLISEEQLQDALEKQKSSQEYENLGRLLVKLGYVKENLLQRALDQYDKRQKFIEILINYKFITREDIGLALEMSKSERLPLFRVLLNLDFLNFEALAKAISIHYDRPFIHLGGRLPDIKTGLAKSVIAFVSEDRKMVPVSIDGKTMTVAMSRPLEPKDHQRLEEHLRFKVETVVAPEDEIVKTQQLFAAISSRGDLPIRDMEIPDSINELMSGALDEPEIEKEVRTVSEKDSLLVKLVNKIIYDAWTSRASDIHIEPYQGKQDIMVRMRIDGCCEVYQRLPYRYKYAIPSRLKIMADLDISERRKPQDGKIDFKKFGPADIELRIATMPTVGSLEDVVIRLLSSSDPVAFNNLGLSERNRELFSSAISQPHGLVLVVGPTGSGKTTTLHSAVATINTSKLKIWTVEDPVEITQEGLRQVQVNHRIGLTFASTLRSFLRLDPDVIMVGEMRDLETAAIAVEASLTGHLVFSTLHTNSAPETLTRLLEMGIDPFGFADSLLCILAQRLVRRLCDRCKEAYIPNDSEWQELMQEYGGDLHTPAGISRDTVKMYRKKGCESCFSTGYRGRLGIHELLASSDQIKNLIKGKCSTDEVRAQANLEGMTSLRQDGIMKVLEGHTDMQEIRRVCMK